MLLGEVAAASADVAATSSRLKKVERLSSVPRRAAARRGADRRGLPLRRAAAGIDRRGMGIPEGPAPAGAGAGHVGAARGRRRARPDRFAGRRRLPGGPPDGPPRPVRPGHGRRAGVPSRAPDGRDPPGRPRGSDGRCRLEGRRRAAPRGPARRDGERGSRRHRVGRPHGRRRGARGLPALAPHAAAADARAVRGGHPLGLRADPPGRRRMEARRRPHPDPPARRRGPRVHAEPRRRHRSRPRDRGRDPRDPDRRPRSSMPRRSRCDPTGAPTPSA